MSAPNEATRRQIQAADPRASTWLSANAGSGKTRVLTDRVARLLLDGASPQNILCLTYTRAAASEMQNRLFQRLGDWAMTPDAALRARLSDLGAGADLGAERLAMARTLFARAIETPGGLKIQTIHSFCASLLRRFPLESGVSPQFTEMDDRAARLLMAEIVEEMADRLAPQAVDAVARYYTEDDFAGLTGEIARQRARFAPLDDAAIRARFGLAPGLGFDTLLARVIGPGDTALLDRLARAMAGGSVTDTKGARALRAVLARPLDDAALATLEHLMLYGAGAKAPFAAKLGAFPTKATQNGLAEDMDDLAALMTRVETLRDTRLALAAADKTIALHRFAGAFLPLYAQRKLARGWLDFDDLILEALALLSDPAVAAWVLYRLDGGIDHVLVDEAQDTSPSQWRVIELLTQELTAGQGARDPGDRSVFVVGDLKQSIYSFQGADPLAFVRMSDHFHDRLAGPAPLQRLELHHSFRSSQAVLRAVDTVFQAEDGPLALMASHRAFHGDLPGRVDLWPLIQTDDDAPDGDWTQPVDRVSPAAAPLLLAQAIARRIREMIDTATTRPGQDGTRRPLHEGDILILVQRRDRLFREIIRACKAQGLQIAGADRLKLAGELAVRDLRALLAFLATPEDDLSLAAALRSPLFGLEEGQLFALAHGRGDAFLWQALRAARATHPEVLAILDDLRANADFLRPFELLERVLLRHGGRERLLGRLGPEAQDGLDELLTQALAYEAMDVPSLTGFLAWLDADDVEVKRQSDSAGRRIRVMTTHGAKGLESPVVILPDTLDTPPQLRDQLLFGEDGTPLWRTAADAMPPLVTQAKAARLAADAEERARLLYVAMTRAETWLIVCGAGKPVEGSWYAAVEAGLSLCAAVPLDTPTGPGLRLSHGNWDAGPLVGAPEAARPPVDMPGWIDRPAPVPPDVAPPLTPSTMGGAKALPGEADPEGWTLEAALDRGTALHLLLEHLPALPRDAWPAAAASLTGDTALLSEAARILTDPALAPLFAPGTLAEVELAAQPDGVALIGTVDRLVIGSDRVLAVDYKSNAAIPDAPEQVPEGLLRQMGAYDAALRLIFPAHRIDTAILWTARARLMPLPSPMVRQAWERATTS